MKGKDVLYRVAAAKVLRHRLMIVEANSLVAYNLLQF